MAGLLQVRGTQSQSIPDPLARELRVSGGLNPPGRGEYPSPGLLGWVVLVQNCDPACQDMPSNASCHAMQ